MSKKKPVKNMKAKILALLLITLIIPATVQALSCSMKANCVAGETEIIQLYDTTNAHGAVAGWSDVSYPSGYDQKICCSDAVALGTNCVAGVEILKLSDTYNAHADTIDSPGYNTTVCISGITGNVYETAPNATCTAGDTCIVSLSGTTNAHLASCNAGDAFPNNIQVCYTSGGGPPGPGGSGVVIKWINAKNPTYKDIEELKVEAIVASDSPINVNTSIIIENATTFEGQTGPISKTVTGNTFALNAGDNTFTAAANNPIVTATPGAPDNLKDLPDGTYQITLNLVDNSGTTLASKTMVIALVNSPRALDIPETNATGIITVLAGILIITIIAQRKN